MKLQAAQHIGQNTFTGYGEGYVHVNGVRYTSNVIVLPDRLIPDWTTAGFDSLRPDDFEILAALDAEIILLGTGTQLRFPAPKLMQALIRKQKGLEPMDIHAVCRTYNVLINEGRKAAAALIFS